MPQTIEGEEEEDKRWFLLYLSGKHSFSLFSVLKTNSFCHCQSSAFTSTFHRGVSSGLPINTSGELANETEPYL